MVTREQMRINGAQVRVHGSFEREVTDESGQPVAEMEVVIIIRGRIPDKQFNQLISREPVRIDYMDGREAVTMFVRIVNHSAVASGTGEGSAFRHDILFRELPESYQRRAATRPVTPAAASSTAPTPRVASQERAPAAGSAQALTAADPSVWGEAIMQMKGVAPRQRVPEEPLTLPELAGIETVLINLRVEALIEVLVAAGVIAAGAVEARFRELLAQRFVAEAIPLVGEKVANRAARDVLQGQ